jgi:hypothetical protein
VSAARRGSGQLRHPPLVAKEGHDTVCSLTDGDGDQRGEVGSCRQRLLIDKGAPKVEVVV